jgi:predicted transport protein
MPVPQTPGEMEALMVAKLKETTGKNLNEWLKILNEVGEMRKSDLVKWLRNEYGLKNSYAYILTGIFVNGGKLVYGDPEALLAIQYKKNEWRELYDAFNELVIELDPEIKIGVCKGYTSYLKDVQFMVAVPKAKEIRIGLAIGDRPFESRLEKAKSLGTNEKIGHQVVLRSHKDMDDELRSYIREAYRYNLKIR